MTTTPELGTDGRAAWQMPLIHRIFRTAFREVRRRVPEVPPTGTVRARALADHLGFTLDGLHHHHTTEDELIWPLLLRRVGPDAPLVARMEEQHHAIDEAVGRVRACVTPWAERPGAATAGPLVAAIDTLLAVLEHHLDEEEREVVPLIDQHLTREEWEEMGRTAFDKFEPRERPIAMGQLLEVATQDEARRMFAELPVPVRVLWAVAGKRQYRRRMERVRGKPLNPVLRRAFRAVGPVAVRTYRRSGGRRAGSAKGLPVLLITVRGRRTGIDRTTPVVYFETDEGFVVCGSGGGMQQEPEWFRNLRRTDRATVQVGAETTPVSARVAGSEERERLWNEVVLPRAPFFTDYERRSGRVVPLAVLAPAGAG